MSSSVPYVHAFSIQTKVTPKIIRRSADYHPSIWGDHFLKYARQSQEAEKNKEQEVVLQKLKDEVNRLLSATATNPSECAQLIDTIQRLGVAYHFQSQISQILEQMQKLVIDSGFDGDNLYIVALKFRLLRQEGYKISCDIFQKFTNKEGKFNDVLASDVHGMLSLYEAAHLRVHGEPILEEALAFTTTHLKAALTSSSSLGLNPFLAGQVQHALRQPIWTGLPRVEARRFISVYHEDPSHNEALLSFAKLDFNTLQKLHQKELSEISSWWKDLDFASKLPFARDRLVECYFWILGVYFEPQHAIARRMVTKVIAMTSVLDDIYDVYGTIEELQRFTDAIERWNINCLDDDQIPECMKYFYKALLRVYEEIEELMVTEGREYCLHHAKEGMKKQVKAYFDEAKWFDNNYTPTLEEYTRLALMSSGYPLLAITSFIFMGDIATEKAFDWASKEPKIVKASSTIARLMDDLATHKVEQKRGDVSSSIECYMKQFGTSEEEAYNELRKQIVDAWKDINEECLEPRDAPMPLLLRVLNLARVMDVVYKDGDSYSNAGGVMKSFIKSMFVDAVPM